MGEFRRLGLLEPLSEDHVTVGSHEITVDAPLFTTEIHLNTDWLESIFPAWGMNMPYSSGQDGKVTVESGSVVVKPFEFSAEPAFSEGSSASARLDQPAWITGSTAHKEIVAEIDPGSDASSIKFADSFLRSFGIHRPLVALEDGTTMEPTYASADDQWHIELPASAGPSGAVLILTPDDIDVRGRQNGNEVPHIGEVRWDEGTRRLEIDVGPQLDHYELLVEQPWLDVNIERPATRDFGWTPEAFDNRSYLSFSIAPEETPSTVAIYPFAAQMGVNEFTGGSADSIHLHEAAWILTTQIGTAGLHIKVRGDSDASNQLTLNTTFLETSGLASAGISDDAGAIESYALTDSHLSIAIPGITNVTIEEDLPLLYDILANSCANALGGDTAKGPTWDDVAQYHGGPDDLGSVGQVHVRHQTFCIQWSMTPGFKFSEYETYSAFFGVTEIWQPGDDPASLAGCGVTTAGDDEVDYREGIAVCTWDEAEDGPLPSEVSVWFWGSAHAYASNTNFKTDPWSVAGCAVSVVAIRITVAALLGAAVSCGAVIKEGETAETIDFLIDHKLQQIAGGTYRVVKTEARLSGVQAWAPEASLRIEIIDPGLRRADTWDALEDVIPRQNDNFDGYQDVHWVVNNVDDATAYYDLDLSVLRTSHYQYNRDTIAIHRNSDTTADLDALASNLDEIVTTVSDHFDKGIDWESPEQECLLFSSINSKLNNYAGHILVQMFGDVPHLPHCDSLVGEMSGGDVLVNVTIKDSSLAPSELDYGPHDVSWEDVYAADNDLIRALAEKLTSNATFISNVQNVTVPENSPSAPCGLGEEPYESVFHASSQGNSIVTNDVISWSGVHEYTICFDPLAGSVEATTWLPGDQQ